MSAPTRVCSSAHARAQVAQPEEFRPLSLGPLSVWPPVVLAPMAGVTNLPFRRLCQSYGAGLYVSEMITARAFLAGHSRTLLLAGSGPDEFPRSVQVYGSRPQDVGEMVSRLVDEGVHHVDLNLGCPVPKVTRHGGGAAIPHRPRLMGRLVAAMVRAAKAVPVTVKMRKGIDAARLSYLQAGRVAQAEGAAAVGLHARTAEQLYSGQADWNAIGELKAALLVPVLGNGDVWECWDALAMLRQTGCDGVIVGRGCLGRPWLFGELASVFSGREPDPPPDCGEVQRVLLEHARALLEFFGPRMGLLQVRKWVDWYTKGFRGSAELRGSLRGIDSLDALRRVLESLDPREPFPFAALRAGRAKGGRTQRVALPEGWLEQDDGDAPHSAALEQAECSAAIEAG
jgi:nifR3 family TIM-barrel protein